MQSRLEEREAELKSQFEERERELIELNQLTVRRMTDSDSKCAALQNSKLILSSSSTVFYFIDDYDRGRWPLKLMTPSNFLSLSKGMIAF